MEKIRITLEVSINEEEMKNPESFPGKVITDRDLCRDIAANVISDYDEIHITANHRTLDGECQYVKTMVEVLSVVAEPVYHRICAVCGTGMDEGLVIKNTHLCMPNNNIDDGTCVCRDIECIDMAMSWLAQNGTSTRLNRNQVEEYNKEHPENPPVISLYRITAKNPYRSAYTSDGYIHGVPETSDMIVPVVPVDWRGTEHYISDEDDDD